MSEADKHDPVGGISGRELETMRRLLRMRPEPHKVAQKPMTTKGSAQRRRREKERQRAIGATCAD